MTINIGILVLILGFIVVLPLVYVAYKNKNDPNGICGFLAFLVAIGAICYAVSCFQKKQTINTDELIKLNHPVSEAAKPTTVAEKYDALN